MSASRRLLLFPFWLGALLIALGSFITFVPGAECGWFLVAAGLSACGVFLPRTAYRVAASLLLIVALVWAHSGYRRGVEYQRWQSTHRGVAP
jgi:hypothetical protein